MYKHPVMHLLRFSQGTVCLICYSSARFHPSSAALFHLSLPAGLFFPWPMSLCFFVSLLRIRQAKVQILPERILPDPLSAVQLTPLSRLHLHPSSKPPTQSCKQAQCWWNNYQQVSLRQSLAASSAIKYLRIRIRKTLLSVTRKCKFELAHMPENSENFFCNYQESSVTFSNVQATV